MKKVDLKGLVIFVLTVLFSSCAQKEQKQNIGYQIKIEEIKGKFVSIDSVERPKIVDVKPAIVTAGIPKFIPANTNVHPFIKPNSVIAGLPVIATPGKDSFLFPQKTLAVHKPVLVGVPDVTLAKDPSVKDQNPYSFSSFGKLQGLKHTQITCMMEDKRGNIWLGIYGAGIVKYDGKNFTLLSGRQGLSNLYVTCLIEDKKGNIWIGTNNNGVTKYDGIYFTAFTLNEGIGDNVTTSLLEDKDGNIWIGGYSGGATKYDGKNFTYYRNEQGLSNKRILCMLQDKDANIWFGTDGHGAIKYDGKNFYRFSEKQGICNNSVTRIKQDKNGDLWFGTSNGVSQYDGKNFTNFSVKEGLIFSEITDLFEDRNGNLWFSTVNGVSKLCHKKAGDQDNYSFTNFTIKEGMSQNFVYCILEDKSGNMWFGTDGGGVSKFQGNLFTHYGTSEGLSDHKIVSTLSDNVGNLWFATQGGGVMKYNGKGFYVYTDKEGLKSNVVWSVFEDRKGNYWFGYTKGVISKFDGKNFEHFRVEVGDASKTIRNITEDKEGNIWFSLEGGGVTKLTQNSVEGTLKYAFTHYLTNNGLSSDYIMNLLSDSKGNMWFCSYGGGLMKFNEKGFTYFVTETGFASNEIWNIKEDSDGNMWIATNAGVYRYDGRTFILFTNKDGLSSGGIGGVLEDKAGNLWFGSGGGLDKLTKNKLVRLFGRSDTAYTDKLYNRKEDDILFKSFSYDDGFLGQSVNGNRCISQAGDGNIWIGTNDRLTVYHPEGDIVNLNAPDIQLTNLSLYNENIPWVKVAQKKDTAIVLGNGVSVGNFEFDSVSRWYGLPQNLSLAYSDNYPTFSFIGSTTYQPKKIRYHYKLEGIDDNWSALTNRTEASYGNLPNGYYTFKVKAMSSAGIWSREFSFVFTIRPPWWKTWWFRTLSVLAIVVLIVLYIKWRERALKQRQKILEKTVDERTVEVNAEKKIVERQKSLIEEKHKEITDSINYAERIQRSFLATKSLLDENLKEHFVFFQPKDVVSGDFYWASKLATSSAGEKFVLVTADSTGHGVPGAIMSLLNITSLESAVKDGFTEPSDILNATRKTIIERLKKDGSENGGKDGMDASLICFDFINNTLNYSAANNPVWIVRASAGSTTTAQLIELDPDKMPVGKHDKDLVPFTQHNFTLQKGDVVYTLTDGMPDQFGGPNGKKFKHKKLKELLITISSEPMQVQKQKLTNELNNWKGDLDQVDDVTLIGVRI